MAETALLRTLSPALRGLERGLRGWLDGTRRYPLSVIGRATLEGLSADLHRQADALDVDRPLLVVMLMGGTGVGKSTLLNALAGSAIAQASFTRPTTRDPVVYYHESVKPDRLDPALRHCRLVPHDRPALEQKVLVDTPDLDSNDLSNRDKLIALLPVADIVLYVGSQEKYHDQVGWELFLQHRRRRAFAFVLNKWDRCTHTTPTGLRPDEDLLRDLRSQGFENPVLFRTCAQRWIDAPSRDAGPEGLPEGEQFRDLVEWLENGLTRLEIEAIKARGVSQLLGHVEEAVAEACPPDLTEIAARTRTAWTKPLGEEAATSSDVLLAAVEPYQREIEQHFTSEGHRRFRGLMASYLGLVTRVRYVGSSLRGRFSILPRREEPNTPAWDLAVLTRACTEVAANRQLDARGRALANRLLVEADTQGFPLNLLTEPTEAVAGLDWRQRHAQVLSEVLQNVERQWSEPTGRRRVVQRVLVFLADWLPLLVFFAALLIFLFRYFNVVGEKTFDVHWTDAILPFVMLLAVLVILHLLIAMLLPMRWPAIREELQRQLAERLRKELDDAYLPVPEEVAATLVQERRQAEKLHAETREVAAWLAQREQSASIAGLYGK